MVAAERVRNEKMAQADWPRIACNRSPMSAVTSARFNQTEKVAVVGAKTPADGGQTDE
jgi:hypothetical protein